jgi:2-polyprenyl-3-methyl-5-hydroxy-6-metoxy-1,4-benzoquinol methylase
MADSLLSERDQAEIERSAAEARNFVLQPVERAQIDRYLNPPADTPYPLEYAFHLLGDIRGKTVLDFGCGKGENIIPLAERGARVIGMDISPDLIAVAQKRLSDANLEASLIVGSAYETGLPDESVDVIFCVALIHHLDIRVVRQEMWRILRKGGVIILKEPVRFSKAYAWLRSLLPAHGDISEYEHPLTREELATMTQPFKMDGTRYFRLPFVPLVSRVLSSKSAAAWRASNWILEHWTGAESYSTGVVTKLQKTG